MIATNTQIYETLRWFINYRSHQISELISEYGLHPEREEEIQIKINGHFFGIQSYVKMYDILFPNKRSEVNF